MKQKTNASLLMNEASIAVSFTGLMTAVSIFFAGILISKFESLGSLIKIPILYLILSTFGFLFATLVYANASGEVARRDRRRFNRYMVVGNIISEYIGVYLLVLAIPLVILNITGDMYIRTATLLASISGLSVYQLSGMSIVNRHFPKSHLSILGFIIAVELVLFGTAQSPYMHQIFSIIMLSFLIGLSVVASGQDE